MYYTYKEIELTLGLYFIAKQHLYEMNMEETSKANQTTFMDLYNYYSYIVHLVDSWLLLLFPDEILLLEMRIDKGMGFDDISIVLGYANHSSVLRKYRQIITKIKLRVN